MCESSAKEKSKERDAITLYHPCEQMETAESQKERKEEGKIDRENRERERPFPPSSFCPFSFSRAHFLSHRYTHTCSLRYTQK